MCLFLQHMLSPHNMKNKNDVFPFLTEIAEIYHYFACLKTLLMFYWSYSNKFDERISGCNMNW